MENLTAALLWFILIAYIGVLALIFASRVKNIEKMLKNLFEEKKED